jgi:hypothetical protein
VTYTSLGGLLCREMCSSVFTLNYFKVLKIDTLCVYLELLVDSLRAKLIRVYEKE